MGPISIFIALMKVVPTGSSAMPAFGASQPMRTPAAMPNSTQT